MIYQRAKRHVQRDTMREAFFESQNTQPLPLILVGKPHLAQLRHYCHMDALEVSKAAGVRYTSVYRMEHNMECRYEDIMRVLYLFSRLLGRPFYLHDIADLRVRQQW